MEANPRPFTFWLCLALAAAVVALVAGLTVFVMWERSIPHPANERYMTAQYRGLGVNGAPGLLGRVWTAVTESTPEGTYRVEYEKPGINQFVGYYPNGRVREQGWCHVELMGFEPMPFPDRHDLWTSTCYRPDGTVGAQVVAGTGIQRIWNENGTLIWELHLDKSTRVLHRLWHDNGQLMSEQVYAAGRKHGPFVRTTRNGIVTIEGAYHHGDRSGTWTYFKEDGSIESTEAYGVPESVTGDTE